MIIYTVTLRLPCPACKREVTWHGSRVALGREAGTTYRIPCENCDSGKQLIPASEATK